MLTARPQMNCHKIEVRRSSSCNKKMTPVYRSAILAVGLTAFSTMAAAQTRIVDEFKFGVLAHDIGLFDRSVEAGADLNFEMLFTPPEFLGVIGSPRPHLGGSLNMAGENKKGYFWPASGGT